MCSHWMLSMASTSPVLTELPAFPGFRDEAFRFFHELAANNNRDWFKPNKATYEDEVRWPMRCLVADVTRQAAEQGLPIQGDPKRALFRIYRDTRFSKNKDPYKTQQTAVFSRTGQRNEPGGLYISIGIHGQRIGAGFWHPENTLLRAFRTRMADDPEGFLHMVSTLEANGIPLQTDEALKRMPRGFEALHDHPIADYMKWKSFFVGDTLTREAVQHSTLTETMLAFTRRVLPLLTYGWEIVDDKGV